MVGHACDSALQNADSLPSSLQAVRFKKVVLVLADEVGVRFDFFARRFDLLNENGKHRESDGLFHAKRIGHKPWFDRPAQGDGHLQDEAARSIEYCRKSLVQDSVESFLVLRVDQIGFRDDDCYRRQWNAGLR